MSPSDSTSRVSEFFSTIRIRKSISSLKSKSGSIKSNKSTHKRSSSYTPYAVYQQAMFPSILRDSDVSQKLIDAINDIPGGRRSVSRLARTCKSFCEPAMDVLWRELDSLVPIVGLFPSHLLKKSRRPGLGLSKTPLDEDWNRVLEYGERVRSITYTERANNVAPSIFGVLEACPRRNFVLPHLRQLTWRAETPAGLARSSMFLNPELQGLDLEIGTRFPQIDGYLAEMSSRVNLKAFSFSSPTSLPENFHELLHRQTSLEKLVLVAPGALSPDIGKWASGLPKLHTLQLDLTGRSVIAVEGFFDTIPSQGYFAATDDGSSDSGVYSEEEDPEIDFTEIKKSSLRLTGDLRSESKAAFSQLHQLQLTGEAANIAVFLKHLTSSLTQLDLVLEDPPDSVAWQDLSVVICERFGVTLQSLRISATGSSRFSDLIRSTSRAEPPNRRLPLKHLSSLPKLVRFEVDLPESVIFEDEDITRLAEECPNLEILKLCPVARFPVSSAPPRITLEGIAPLTSNCRRLHTLALVLNAKGGSEEVLHSRQASSRSLLRLGLGHSWVSDPLHVTILLSHLAPHLESLKAFHEKNRPGYVEAHARTWNTVMEYLPHLQDMRLVERKYAPQPIEPPQRVLADQIVDATTVIAEKKMTYAESSAQSSPVFVTQTLQDQPLVADDEVKHVVFLQSLARGKNARKEAEALRAQKQAAADEDLRRVILMQSVVRGKSARKEAEALRAQKQAAADEDLKRVILMQSLVRGRNARREVEALRAEVNSETEVEEDEGVVLDDDDVKKVIYLQSLVRGRQARKEVEGLRGVGRETTEPSEYDEKSAGEASYFIMIPAMVTGLVSTAFRVAFFIPLYIPCRILDMSLAAIHARRTPIGEKEMDNEKPSRSNTESSTSSGELLDISPVCL